MKEEKEETFTPSISAHIYPFLSIEIEIDEMVLLVRNKKLIAGFNPKTRAAYIVTPIGSISTKVIDIWLKEKGYKKKIEVPLSMLENMFYFQITAKHSGLLKES